MTINKPHIPWAKLSRDETDAVVGWHSLIDHSADVAAVFEAILRVRRSQTGSRGSPGGRIFLPSGAPASQRS
jgi:HD domain